MPWVGQVDYPRHKGGNEQILVSYHKLIIDEGKCKLLHERHTIVAQKTQYPKIQDGRGFSGIVKNAYCGSCTIIPPGIKYVQKVGCPENHVGSRSRKRGFKENLARNLHI